MHYRCGRGRPRTRHYPGGSSSLPLYCLERMIARRLRLRRPAGRAADPTPVPCRSWRGPESYQCSFFPFMLQACPQAEGPPGAS
jgi:hypothetical protein